ncbi:MAG: AAA family ATPase [Acidimicrobiia bacterium]|nr:AAA family ATPase [Acidimicrobiia bacterium]
MDVSALAADSVVGAGKADVAEIRERGRRRRLTVLMGMLGVAFAFLVWRLVAGDPFTPGDLVPSMPSDIGWWLPGILIAAVLMAALLGPLVFSGRSPHILFRPSEIEIGLDDVVGLDEVKEEVVRSLNLFLGFKTFQDRMGGTPRRALLFEGKPGTGKSYMAKAMARDAGVPFLFVSASSFQSQYYGQTNRKIRSFFKTLREYARKEGGAIGFIDEFDAIAASRRGMNAVPADAAHDSARGISAAVERSEGAHESLSGIVNELLVQLQSFDTPTTGQRVRGKLVDWLNVWLPHHRQLAKAKPKRANILVIGATNRAKDLDPALLRPGRFDRSIHFDLPGRSGRRAIVDYYLDRKRHAPALDDPAARDNLAAMTAGYSPVMIEHLFDEALVWALRSDREEMTWDDIGQAKMTEEVGIKQSVEYAEVDARTVATHEAGHAVVAYLAGKGRKLDVLSIVKRRGSLGLLAHSDLEERHLMSRSEMIARMQIALGGLVAEQLWFGEHTNGPASDLDFATKLGARMIASYGMGDSLVSWEAAESPGLVNKVLAGDTTREQLGRLLDDCRGDVEDLLEGNGHLVEALRDSLLARHELIGDEILEVLRAAEAESGLTADDDDLALDLTHEESVAGVDDDTDVVWRWV